MGEPSIDFNGGYIACSLAHTGVSGEREDAGMVVAKDQTEQGVQAEEPANQNHRLCPSPGLAGVVREVQRDGRQTTVFPPLRNWRRNLRSLILHLVICLFDPGIKSRV